MSAPRGSVRREVRINRSPADVWEVIGAPARIHEWFPGITTSSVEGDTRTIVTGAGLSLPEEIVTNDSVQRRFQYRITSPIFQEHLSTIDVLALDDGASLVVYGADAAPATMALVIAGAAGNALENLRDLMEAAG